MEARGMYDFNATAEDELNFKKGDILKIMGSQDEWYKAELHGQEGFIPQNYVDMQTPSWFQENASRGAAEELLMNNEVGCFVIRGCQSSPGDFSISVKHDCDVQHFKVMKDSKGHYFLWSERFTSLNKLVEFYKSTSISKLREIYLIDGGHDNMKCSSTIQTLSQLKRGSLPEQRNYVNTPSATTAPQRRASDQPHNQLSKRAGLEERAHTIGHTGRSSPVSTSASVSRRTAETMPNPQRAATSIKAKAIYDFIAEEDDELGFGSGDIIEVLDRSDATWWKGRLRGKSGLFPANYTSPL